ncbi:protein singles bar isoform X2 [Folsomia candida]|uniref:MARVEL domain-containing protein n=1 Tax=Folsomia candida TaxID=158441 RepID=A0A226EUM5_FOLCA|nr:protein singles bar isoform X2 [Folsomia candida]OXA61292.1 hypothetical protein Fcan01_03726 [Folsomia candida]
MKYCDYNKMARIGVAPTAVPVRPLPTIVRNGRGGSCSCPSNIISSPRAIRYNHRSVGASSKKLCQCCICGCVHVDFMKRMPGILKLIEAVFGIICQYLLLEFGSSHSSDLGSCYTEFLIGVSYCLITTVLLMTCYLFSKSTYHLLRSSIFETAFNLLACCLYLSSSTYLAYIVNTRLFLKYLIVPFYQVFPALSAAYVLGFVTGVVHGIDGYFAYRYLQIGQ